MEQPLIKLLKNWTADNLQLDDEQKAVINALINKVCSPPVLALPNACFPYSIDLDASDYGVGWALCQTNPDGERKPIGFWSRALLPVEDNYLAFDREQVESYVHLKSSTFTSCTNGLMCSWNTLPSIRF